MKITLSAFGGAAMLATLGLCGCATEEYVDKAVANVQTQVSANQAELSAHAGRLDAHEARLAKLDGQTQAAMAKAEEAERLAAGDFNATKVSEATVLFATGSSELSSEDESKLAALASQLKSDNKNVYLEIQGHADAQGSPKFNERLGAARAYAVFLYLAGQGVPLNRMEEVTLGEATPSASNSTAEGRAQNRRVVVAVVQ